ncbi:hypothetical protein [Amycolatopsis sp. PS_44_ISF1]|uniref:hypothetical protein n=1 Tax=Amycolatopsis sp. PS_44_ISF1 TaxID=2974917 RepID=UPI0028DED8EC|nr:hypothetical protein [Amycolatopsis sp. PS_44_ISF1]MDT8909526.1 hypothetical protein [Amycolatopsis sp. PS_44_ISF1]
MLRSTITGLAGAGFLVLAPAVATASPGTGDPGAASASAPSGDEYPAAAAMGVVALGSAGIALVRHKTRR